MTGTSRTIGLLLAAGAGRRMGTPKALIKGGDGIPWVVAAARTLVAGGCARTVVVIGAAADKVRPLLEAEPVTIVEADDWNEGMASSLRAGLGAIAGREADSALIHLVDLPDVGPEVVRRLAALSAPEVLARASYGNVPGHPVLIGREHWQAIADESAGDSGARAYLAQHSVVDVDCADLATGHDIDT